MHRIKQFYKNYLFKRQLKQLFLKHRSLIETPFSIPNIQNLIIEPYTYIGPNAIFTTYAKIYIKSGTILGPRVKIHTGNHNYQGSMLPYDEIMISKDVVINNNVWIGGDVIILPGVNIGEGCVIGSGAVVSKSLPPLSIAVGNPIKIISTRNQESYFALKQANKIYLMKKFIK
jgi:acetyltransferase-like isoleucine patch superfamily enzyme